MSRTESQPSAAWSLCGVRTRCCGSSGTFRITLGILSEPRAANVFFWGMPVSFSIKIGPSFLTALSAAVTYWLNQRVRRKQWLPMQRELEALLNSDQPVLQPEPPKKNIMTQTILIGIVLISLGAIVFVRGSGPKTPAIEYSDPVSQMLENILTEPTVAQGSGVLERRSAILELVFGP